MTTAKTTQTFTGTVVKLSSTQTARVAIKTVKTHPIYKKRYTQTRYFLVHDQDSTAKVGDVVTITTCKPVSKRKRWMIVTK